MKKLFALTILALLLFSSPVIAEEIIVRVQDYELTETEFLETSEKMRSELDAPEEATDADIDMYITNTIVEDFIINSLIRIDIKEKEMKATEEEIDQEIDQLIQDIIETQDVDNEDEAFEHIEAISGLTKENIREQAGENISFVKLQFYYMEKAQEELDSIDMEAEYEKYLEEVDDPMTFEEFTENVLAQRTNELLQQRINDLYEENVNDIEINL